MKTLTKALIFVGVFIFAFVVTMVVIFCIFQQIPDVLVTCVLGTGTAELVAAALIEISKKKYSADLEEENDEGTDNVDNSEFIES